MRSNLHRSVWLTGCRSPWPNVLCRLDRGAGAGSCYKLVAQPGVETRRGNEVECTRVPWPGRRGWQVRFSLLQEVLSDDPTCSC